MAHATYSARLRYLDAHDLDDSDVNFDGLDVRGHDNEKLGDIDGFIVDGEVGRVYYAVIDSGGWFATRRFLLPIGHAALDRERNALNVDVGKDALKRYPEFDENEFRSFSDEDLRTFENRMAAACCPTEPLEDVSVGASYFERRRHYRQPEWWSEGSYSRERLRPVEVTGASAAAAAARPVRGYEREEAREETLERDGGVREHVTARESGEVSPHLGKRAQPGDILGIETGGETTGVGDTAEDEDKRRRAAERAVRDDAPRSDR